MNDQIRLALSLGAACLIHAVALQQGFGVASAVTGDTHPRLRPLIVAAR